MTEKISAAQVDAMLATMGDYAREHNGIENTDKYERQIRAHISALQSEADDLRADIDVAKNERAFLQSEADRLKKADESKYDALMQIAQWCDAYPQDVFEPLPPDALKRADKVLAEAGISIGALHAGWSRHLLDGVGRTARAALSATQQDASPVQPAQKTE